MIRSMMIFGIVIPVALLQVSCGTNGRDGGVSPAQNPNLKPFAAGLWGGDHVEMNVGSSSTAIQLDCARSTIEQPIMVSDSARFDVEGYLVFENGASAINPGRRWSRYKGSFSGDVLNLTITYIQDGQTVSNSYTLSQGVHGRVSRCENSMTLNAQFTDG